MLMAKEWKRRPKIRELPGNVTTTWRRQPRCSPRCSRGGRLSSLGTASVSSRLPKMTSPRFLGKDGWNWNFRLFFSECKFLFFFSPKMAWKKEGKAYLAHPCPPSRPWFLSHAQTRKKFGLDLASSPTSRTLDPASGTFPLWLRRTVQSWILWNSPSSEDDLAPQIYIRTRRRCGRTHRSSPPNKNEFCGDSQCPSP